MAIEIIPKPKLRVETKFSFIDTLYYLVFVLIFLSAFIYLNSFFIERKVNAELENVNALIAQEETQENKELEKRVLSLSAKIDAFSKILSNYKTPSQWIELLGPICHKKVFFSGVKLDVENNKVKISSKTQDFKTLREQILILEDKKWIDNVQFSGISLDGGDSVTFDVNFLLNNKALEEYNLEASEQNNNVEASEQDAEIQGNIEE